MSDEKAVAVRQPDPLIMADGDSAMSVLDVKRQVTLVQSVMRNVMQDKVHYGTIPGCGDKPALLQPGAQKLLMTFHLAPKYIIETRDVPGGHREYDVTCELYSINTGVFIGQGVGVASTMESKWRYRNNLSDTGEPIPKDYKEKKAEYKRNGYVCRKDESSNTWKWLKQERVEHDNPADYYNTCKKMAVKRALVSATISATAASDIFAQDIEEAPELYGGNPDDSFSDIIDKKNAAEAEFDEDTGEVSQPPDRPEPPDESYDDAPLACYDIPSPQQAQDDNSPDGLRLKLDTLAAQIASTHPDYKTKQEVIRRCTEWTNKQGEYIPGKTNVKYISDKAVVVAYGKAKEIAEGKVKNKPVEKQQQQYDDDLPF